MRKVFGLFTLAAAIVVMALAVVEAQADPAIVIKNNGECSMAGSDADGNIIFGGIGQVETVVENGNRVMLTCKGENITNLSGTGQSYTAFLCGVYPPSGGFVVTTDSHATVSASGVATLTCTYTKP